ncbi:hypothetical protein EJ063_08345 [Vibrio aquaticus]|uniref:Uncharacterized protein n=1 Tax=Vibrio aquaticus TaxID=2496559 RepID=A0A432CY61_9VIBR|nr:hypothetical protein [Vibrio aquaticus]RTZ16792.1 hypothetical protein EJ063_08345 [Vibrio aquaticus]
MKKLALIAVMCSVSFGASASADVVIPKERVVCQTEAAMKTFLARKKASNKVAKLPGECRKIDRKRRGEIKQRHKGFFEVKTTIGDTVYVDKDAVRFN